MGFQPFEMPISVGDTEIYVDVCRKRPFNHYLHQFRHVGCTKLPEDGMMTWSTANSSKHTLENFLFLLISPFLAFSILPLTSVYLTPQLNLQNLKNNMHYTFPSTMNVYNTLCRTWFLLYHTIRSKRGKDWNKRNTHKGSWKSLDTFRHFWLRSSV